MRKDHCAVLCRGRRGRGTASGVAAVLITRGAPSWGAVTRRQIGLQRQRQRQRRRAMLCCRWHRCVLHCCLPPLPSHAVCVASAVCLPPADSIRYPRVYQQRSGSLPSQLSTVQKRVSAAHRCRRNLPLSSQLAYLAFSAVRQQRSSSSRRGTNPPFLRRRCSIHSTRSDHRHRCRHQAQMRARMEEATQMRASSRRMQTLRRYAKSLHLRFRSP